MPRGNISRRHFLGHTLASVLVLPARAELPSQQDGFRVLEAREGKLQLLPEPAPPTAVWGYNGGVPGPILRFKKGEEVKVRLVNKLAQPTSLNWHGVRIVNAMDGVAGLTQEPVPPGRHLRLSFYPARQRTLLVSSARLPFIGEQQGRGLYGVMIVDGAGIAYGRPRISSFSLIGSSMAMARSPVSMPPRTLRARAASGRSSP